MIVGILIGLGIGAVACLVVAYYAVKGCTPWGPR
jgi:hypothetical protein